MKFSIIVPVYNVEKFLPRCLDSVLMQEFDDYEIIAVNDGSTDNSAVILNSYKTRTNKLNVITQKNKGLGGARNTGIRNARGEYLVFLDSDDYISPLMLSTISQYLDKYNLDILTFDCVRVSNNGEEIERVSVKEFQDRYTQLTAKQYLLMEPTSCTKVYRTSLYVDNCIEFPEQLWYEDLATVFKLALYTSNIGYLKEAFYYYVQQPESITHSVNTDRMMEIITAFDSNVQYYKEHNQFQAFYDELEWNCALHVLYYSAFRLMICGYNYRNMQKLYEYSKSIFPNIENNKYVLERMHSRDMMSLVMNHHYLIFYIKTGFFLKGINRLHTVRRYLGIEKG